MDFLLYVLASVFVTFVFSGYATNEDEDMMAILAGVFWPITAVIVIAETTRYCWKHR